MLRIVLVEKFAKVKTTFWKQRRPYENNDDIMKSKTTLCNQRRHSENNDIMDTMRPEAGQADGNDVLLEHHIRLQPHQRYVVPETKGVN